MLVLDDLHLDDDPHLAPYAVEGVEDGEPTVEGVGRATIGQRVETDVDLTNSIMSGVRVIVHQPEFLGRGGGKNYGVSLLSIVFPTNLQ